MPSRIILLSGPVAAGKSRLANSLAEQFQCVVVKTHEIIEAKVGSARKRGALQKAGETLDRETNGQWVAEALGRIAVNHDPKAVLIVDSVRIRPQCASMRKAFGYLVTHIHLSAPVEVLEERYKHRKGTVEELKTYAEVRANPTEAAVDELREIADIQVDTTRNSPEDIVVRVASHLGFYGRGLDRLVDVIVGGQYGSEGKGQVAAYLAREYSLLVRVGGPNAGHTVYESASPVTFHCLPSGSRVAEAENAKLVIGPGAVLWCGEKGFLQEILDAGIDSERLSVDPQAMLIEQCDRDFEAGELKDSIASTAQGVGAATSRKILRTGAKPPVRLAKDEKLLRPYIRETRDIIDAAFRRGEKILLEGTQGTGLSLHHGAYPYVTSRDTTVSGCLAEAGIAPSRVRRVLMVCRTYPIRVESPPKGTSGPMVNELSYEEMSRRTSKPIEELKAAEKTSTTKRQRRISEFDWVLLRRSASLNGPTDIVLTFADYLDIENEGARRFDQLTADTIRFIEEVERVAGAPVSLISTRFHYRSIIDRRDW